MMAATMVNRTMDMCDTLRPSALPLVCSVDRTCMPQAFTTRLKLFKGAAMKTLDIGLDGTALSADPLGRILQLSTFHPRHGIVAAAAFEQFDGEQFYTPGYVRKYRTRMLAMVRSADPGFGVRFQDSPRECTIEILDVNKAVVIYDLQQHLSARVTLTVHSDGDITQDTVVSSSAATAIELPYCFGLGISVNRASYGQLTEAGPIPIPPVENRFDVLMHGYGFVIHNRNLGASVTGFLSVDGHDVNLQGLASGLYPKTVPAEFSGCLCIPSKSSRTISARFKLYPVKGERILSEKPALAVPFQESGSTCWKNNKSDASFIVRRNLEYILGCCAIPVGRDDVALLTDHVALPLGWNRDNYWQVRFLLDVHSKADDYLFPDSARQYSARIRKVIRGHLQWVFRTAERPKGFWHRSYLVTGVPKDGPVFQLDQQCYPFLEACDYIEAFPKEAEFVHSLLKESNADQVIRLLENMRNKTGLYPTEETPADDAVEYPFHFSSHVLLWYTLSRLSAASRTVQAWGRLNAAQLKDWADQLRSVTLREFTTVNPTNRKRMWAYLTSGSGDYRFYHDANDIPTLFAREWGFVVSEEEKQVWYNTMRFGISPQNSEGYATGGPFAGLGSIHTPGPWPLGYAQEFLFAQMTNDPAAELSAWRRLHASTSWDGLFSEAVDVKTAECTSKAWFSWPGSMVGSAILRSPSASCIFQFRESSGLCRW